MIHKHFKTKAKFNEELAKSPSGISDSDICFIKDTGEIWTHGKFYAQTDSVLGRIGTAEGNITSLGNSIQSLDGIFEKDHFHPKDQYQQSFHKLKYLKTTNQKKKYNFFLK